MLKRFISYYKPYKVLFAFDMLACILIAACDLFYPMITKSIINDYVPNKKLGLMIAWCLILLAVYAAKYALNFFVNYYGHIVGLKMQADMRKDLFSHLQKLPFTYFDNTKTGTLMSRLINDLNEVSELAHHGPENLFLSVLMLIGSFIMLASINLSLTLIVFAFVPFIVLFAMLLRSKMAKASRQSREQIAEVNANIETAVAGVRVSRAYTSEKYEEDKFEAENGLFYKFRKYFLYVMSTFHSSMTFFTDLLYIIILIAGGIFYFNAIIDTGEFAAYILYVSMFLNPIRRFITLFDQFNDGMTGFKRFTEIMDIPPEPENENAKELTDVSGDIVFDNVSFHYSNENEKLVLNNLSMKIESGKTAALVGPSGGGKTTICNLIPRFYEIDSGDISIDGISIRDLSRYSLRKNIGIVSQDVFLFNGTIRENIAYGKLDATDEEIIDAAKKANIYDYVMTLEKGFETNVGERGVTLSGGQKQRISIARVFLKNPSILILDEATSALDNATEVQIQAALEELSKGRTVLVVAHRLSTVKNADEIIVITHEGIKERGTHDELLNLDRGIYKELYQYQLR